MSFKKALVIGTFERDKEGDITNQPSDFQPSQKVKDLTRRVLEDYSLGHNILHKTYEELNNRSLLMVLDEDQKAFNSYIPPRSDDPFESWKAQTVRPLTRNKIISIAAHITARVLVPKPVAQNDQDEEDKEASEVIRDLVEWVVDNSDYEQTMLFSIIAALVNPALIINTEFSEVMQKVKIKKANGEIEIKEMVDEIFSGFQMNIIPVEEFLITNVYEFNVQKQRAVGRRKYIEFEQAEAAYGEHEDFKFVRPGIKVLFDPDNETFYDQYDEENPTLVEEFTYYNRREDVQVTFVNGVLVTDSEQRIKHRDRKDRPKYPFAKTIYEPFDEKRFFYGKSAVSKLGPDQALVDQMWNMRLDASFLSIMPPMNIFGDEERGSNVMVPGATNYFQKGVEIQPGNPEFNFPAADSSIAMLENSMSESSQDASRAGIRTGPAATAREIAINERNANIQLGLFARMIAQLVIDFGHLLIEDIIHHMTVGDVMEVTTGNVRMKFPTFLLPDRMEEGRKMTKVIDFTDEFAGQDMTEEEIKTKGFNLMTEEGGMEGEKRIYRVNPALFAKLNFLITVNPDVMTPKIEAFEKAMKLEGYDRMIQNPLVDQTAVTRDFLVDVFADGETDKYMKKAEQLLGAQPQQAGPAGKTSAIVEQATGSGSLSELVTGVAR